MAKERKTKNKRDAKAAQPAEKPSRRARDPSIMPTSRGQETGATKPRAEESAD